VVLGSTASSCVDPIPEYAATTEDTTFSAEETEDQNAEEPHHTSGSNLAEMLQQIWQLVGHVMKLSGASD